MNHTRARDHPGQEFYEIVPQPDGTRDVYLMPLGEPNPTFLVRGVVPWPGLEDDIRARFYDWCDAAEEIDL